MASEDLFEAEYSEKIEAQLDLKGEANGNRLKDDAIISDKAISESLAQQSNGNTNANTPDQTVITSEKAADAPQSVDQEGKLISLPMSRIRNIMKMDQDFQMASNEAVFFMAKATELFIESLARESYSYTAQSKKKTVQKRDVDLAISAVDSLMFLDGAMSL